MNNIAIILAAGMGNRFGECKQFINFKNKPLWKHVYDTTITIINPSNVVVVGVDIVGGETRSNSVINGLEYFYKTKIEYDKVIILEAARPLIKSSQIKNLLDLDSKSSTYVMPMVNTPIKRNYEYCDREDYFDLLTPQAFDYKLLYSAYKKHPNGNYTDETKLMYETYNIKPFFIKDGKNLFKLTYKTDLPILEHLYNLQLLGEI